MFFSPVDPMWEALSIVVLFFVISDLCFCLIEAVKAGQKILTKQQESMSEEDRKRISKRKKRGEKQREKEKGEKANSKGKGNNEKEKEIAKIYPSLKDLTVSSASSDSSDSELDKDEEADLEEEAAQYERDRYDPDWPYRANLMKRGVLVNKRTTRRKKKRKKKRKK